MPMIELEMIDGTKLYLMFNMIESVNIANDAAGTDGKASIVGTSGGLQYRVKDTYEQINEKVKSVAIQLQAGAQTVRVSQDFLRKIQQGL